MLTSLKSHKELNSQLKTCILLFFKEKLQKNPQITSHFNISVSLCAVQKKESLDWLSSFQ